MQRLQCDCPRPKVDEAWICAALAVANGRIPFSRSPEFVGVRTSERRDCTYICDPLHAPRAPQAASFLICTAPEGARRRVIPSPHPPPMTYTPEGARRRVLQSATVHARGSERVAPNESGGARTCLALDRRLRMRDLPGPSRDDPGHRQPGRPAAAHVRAAALLRSSFPLWKRTTMMS